MTKSWIFLIVGIIAEVAGTTGMRALVHNHAMLSQLSATVGIIFAYFCVSRGVEKIPMGVAYAIWSGVGIVLTAIIGVTVLKQSLDLPAIIGIILIIAGVVVMNVFSNSTH